MSEPIVIGYKGCYSHTPERPHTPERHMIINPLPEHVAKLKARGLEPAANGYLEVPGNCPGCMQDRIDYLKRNLRIADEVGDEKAVASYSAEIAALEA